MVKEAEDNAEADRVARENIETRNQLESYLYGLRSTIQDTLKDKISAPDKEKLGGLITSTLTWLEEHQSEAKAVYDEKRQEVEAVANPIIAQAYKSGPPPSDDPGAPDQPPSGSSESSSSSGPTVEEVD